MSRSDLVTSLTTVLSEGPRLRIALLFGSSARGTDHAGSDVDVAILPEDLGLPLADELALQARLALACKREVDLVRLDRCTPTLRYRVARDGVPLWGDHSTVAAFRARAGIEHAELAPLVRRAAELFRRRVAGSAGNVR